MEFYWPSLGFEKVQLFFETDIFLNPNLKYTGHRGAVNSVALHPVKHLAISGGGDAECHLWPFRESQLENDDPLISQAPILTYGSHSAVVTW